MFDKLYTDIREEFQVGVDGDIVSFSTGVSLKLDGIKPLAKFYQSSQEFAKAYMELLRSDDRRDHDILVDIYRQVKQAE